MAGNEEMREGTQKKIKCKGLAGGGMGQEIMMFVQGSGSLIQ